MSGLTSAISRNRRSLSRRRCSDRWRWIALPSLIIDVLDERHVVVGERELVGRVGAESPLGSSVSPMTTLIPLTTPWSSNSGGPL
ncbi:hypothetical protein C8039_11645 [Halogeometricum sp. wsp3]|nr:hypothetical protein C8039_11645 [Halogeometricum sp. wsp3]